MQWNISYLQNDGVVHVKTSGTMNLELIKQLCSETVSTAAKHDSGKILVDHRDVTPDVSIIDTYQVPRILIECGWSRSARIAFVYAQTPEKDEIYDFFKITAQNIGVFVDLFNDPDEALAWLTGVK